MRSIEKSARRAQASRDVQAQLAGVWMWESKSLQDWDDDLAALAGLQAARSVARTRLRAAGASWNATVGRLRQAARDVVQLARVRFRDDPVKRGMFERLKVSRRHRLRTQEDGRAAREAWAQADPDWLPLPELSLADVDALLEQCDARAAAYSQRHTAERKAASQFSHQARSLHRDSVAWYKVATIRFRADTAEGLMIRRVVPTTTSRRRRRGQGETSQAPEAGIATAGEETKAA